LVYDPLDVRQFAFVELKTFVEVAGIYNTHVASHIFTDEAAQIAIKAGIKSIEHGFLMSKKLFR
jgi:imidazolonepropionase-like amidohydrolase